MTEQVSSLFMDELSRTYTKAQTYKHEIINGVSYIVPCSNEVEDFKLDTSERRNEFIKDFLNLLTGISRARRGFRAHDIVLAEIETGDTHHYDKKDAKDYYDSMNQCAEHLTEFFNAWGPLGILGSRLHYSPIQTTSKGVDLHSRYETVLFDPNYSHLSWHWAQLPTDNIPVGVQAYSQIAKHFFPKIQGGQYPRYGIRDDKKDFYLNYCESVHIILSDMRFCDMLFHHEIWTLDKNEILNEDCDIPDYSALRASSIGLEVVCSDEKWKLNAYGGSIIQHTQVFYMLNLLQKGEYVAICKHTTCQRPFVSDNPKAEYCCPEHAANARKMRYRKKKEAEANAQKTREQ